MADKTPSTVTAESSRLSIRLPLSIGGMILIALVAYFYFQKAVVDLRLHSADEQTAIFEDMREKVEKSDDPIQGAEFLEYALGYYPSGTKQVAGSPLDQIVERARRTAVREMIEILRKKTGQDFGDDPQRWIKGLKLPKKQ